MKFIEANSVQKLPHCEELFKKYFDPWYRAEDRTQRKFEATRPDMLESSSLKGKSGADLSTIDAEYQKKVLHQISVMTEAAKKDWKSYLPVQEPIDENWIGKFDSYYDESRVSEVVATSDPSDFSNNYLVLCCEFGAVIGLVMRTREPSLDWIPDWPYWESAIWDSRTGNLVPVFHWAIKKMSSYGIDDGFQDKTLACLNMLQLKAEGKWVENQDGTIGG